ncbi:hypothetical protein [Nocardioides sp. R-C-SC26]|uniref:hypothetical protein n=1 Tax=Nocardioides sp. R-C-SC26 TaxID=2870414 RepID=UPI001E2B98D3|nr:hypothetical protein [Nocardioides sp. R-C-SC26]
MSQTASAPSPTSGPTPGPAAGTPTAHVVGLDIPAPGTPAPLVTSDGARNLAEDVPGLLNRLQVLAVATVVIFGVVSALIQVLSWQAGGRAADNTEQVVRVQKIQSLLLRADALATNGFLIGGLEPADQRAAYQSSIEDVLRLITDAAQAQPADRNVLADLNAAVTDYTTAVAQARDYNRQQFPIGIAYLNRAGDGLRADALPIVRALVDANSDRAVEEMESQHPWWLTGMGLLAVGSLFLVNRSIATRFHRRINVGIATAGGIVLVVALLGAYHASSKHSDNAETRAGPYADAVQEARARSALNDAKAQESQGLINRGSGAAYEESWTAAAEVVQANASPRTLALWERYAEQHGQIRAADDSGDWDRAVRLATTDETEAATALLDEADASADRVSAVAATDAADAFRSGGVISLVLIVLTLLGALAAAGAATWGVNQRRREYA